MFGVAVARSNNNSLSRRTRRRPLASSVDRYRIVTNQGLRRWHRSKCAPLARSVRTGRAARTERPGSEARSHELSRTPLTVQLHFAATSVRPRCSVCCVSFAVVRQGRMIDTTRSALDRSSFVRKQKSLRRCNETVSDGHFSRKSLTRLPALTRLTRTPETTMNRNLSTVTKNPRAPVPLQIADPAASLRQS